jgi:AcrR family transcriptional regulator
MSSPAAAPARRRLAGRQAETVDGLLDAAVVEIAETGYDGLTVRGVARRAGVSPATAYTYFASKEHLLTEVFWRRLSQLEPPIIDGRRSVADRVGESMRGIAMLVAGEPELAAGVTTALLAHDPDVEALRDAIARSVTQRIGAALGADARPAVLRSLTFTFFGALITAGVGNIGYSELPAVMTEATALMTGRRR